MNLLIISALMIFIIAALFLPSILSKEVRKIDDNIRSNSAGNFIRLSKGFTHYEISGPEKGEAVLLIHGFSVPYYMWDRTFMYLAENGCRVIRFDLYGRGLSDRPDVVYGRNLFVEQISDLIDFLDIKRKVVLIGTSMGGAVAAAFAADFPGKVSRLVLIDPVLGKFSNILINLPVIGDYIANIFYIPGLPEKQLKDFFHPERFPQWDKLFLEQMKYRGFSRAIISTLRNFLFKDLLTDYEELSRNKIKIKLIWGREDSVAGMETAEKLARILSTEIFWVEEAGHLPHYERPEMVNNAILDFLSEKSQTI